MLNKKNSLNTERRYSLSDFLKFILALCVVFMAIGHLRSFANRARASEIWNIARKITFARHISVANFGCSPGECKPEIYNKYKNKASKDIIDALQSEKCRFDAVLTQEQSSCFFADLAIKGLLYAGINLHTSFDNYTEISPDSPIHGTHFIVHTYEHKQTKFPESYGNIVIPNGFTAVSISKPIPLKIAKMIDQKYDDGKPYTGNVLVAESKDNNLIQHHCTSFPIDASENKKLKKQKTSRKIKNALNAIYTNNKTKCYISFVIDVTKNNQQNDVSEEQEIENINENETKEYNSSETSQDNESQKNNENLEGDYQKNDRHKIEEKDKINNENQENNSPQIEVKSSTDQENQRTINSEVSENKQGNNSAKNDNNEEINSRENNNNIVNNDGTNNAIDSNHNNINENEENLEDKKINNDKKTDIKYTSNDEENSSIR